MQQIAISFITKVAFGIAYGFLFLQFYNGDDTWQYHNISVTQYRQLLEDPNQFIKETGLRTSGSSSLNALYDTKNSFWNKLDDELFIKMLVLFNIFSFGHYYVNVVLFCFVVYTGNLLLFRLLIRSYPKSSQLLQISIFYIPMVVFWLSGIRKEGILFLGIAMVLFYFDLLIRREKHFVMNFFYFFTGLGLLLLMRNFMAMCITPCLMAWALCHRFRWKASYTFVIVSLGCIIVFFTIGFIPGLPDLPDKVTQRQYDFFNLIGNTRLPLDSLKGSYPSFLEVFPQAVNHSFFRPYLTESKGLLQVISAIDILSFFICFIIAVLFSNKNWRSIMRNPVWLTLLFTSFFAYLLIGYTVPFPGAFVRYKAIYELLFFCSFAILANGEKIKSKLLKYFVI